MCWLKFKISLQTSCADLCYLGTQRVVICTWFNHSQPFILRCNQKTIKDCLAEVTDPKGQPTAAIFLNQHNLQLCSKVLIFIDIGNYNSRPSCLEQTDTIREIYNCSKCKGEMSMRKSSPSWYIQKATQPLYVRFREYWGRGTQKL